MIHPTASPLSHQLRDAPNDETIHQLVEGMHPADVAAHVAELDGPHTWGILSTLPENLRARVFEQLSAGDQLEIAQILDQANLVKLSLAMSSEARARFIKRLAPNQQSALLPDLVQAERDAILRHAGYGKESAGAIMTSDYATLTPDITASQAIDQLRLEAPNRDTIHYLWVIDSQRKLLGRVSLQNIVVAPADRLIGDFVEHTMMAAVSDDQEDVATKIARYDLVALPVIDVDGKLVGVVAHDDALDILQEEATEDIHLAATVGKLEGRVRKAKMFTLYRKRVFWLVLLVFGNIFSGAGIAYFEETIAAYVALVFFLPLIIDSSGNAGSQSATLMVRAIATGDVQMRDWRNMLGRELGVATLLGVTMAIAVSALGLIRGGPDIALVVAVTMIIVVIVGSMIGMSLPFALSRLKLDPATASAPLITSIADAIGVIIYFGMATIILDVGFPD